jgi:protein-tyrosine phosphatase
MENVDTEPSAERHVPLVNCFNFRDLGGYPTRDGGSLRWRKLFRADGLTKLDDTDCRALADLGLTTVIDLRTVSELETRGKFPIEILTVDYHHLPLSETIPGQEEVPDWGQSEFVTARYTQLLGLGWESIASAIRLLANEESLPAVFHCSAGKDRTGVLACVVLGALGVPDEIIIDDYALSAIGTSRLMQSLRDEYADAVEEVEKYAAAILRVMPESMAGFIDHIHAQYGDFDELVRQLGVADAVSRLSQLVVEPAG